MLCTCFKSNKGAKSYFNIEVYLIIYADTTEQVDNTA